MAEIRNMPPGRAGRLWLDARRRTARLAADLLERKLLLLNIEQRRLRQAADDSARRWREAWLAADEHAARAGFLAGPDDRMLSAPTGPAELTVAWTNLMGARYPTGAQVRAPAVHSGQRAPGSAALLASTKAATAALAAAADHAVVVAALRVVTAEAQATRRRLRAISHRWLPRLERALATLVHDLDESEREESVRLRLAGAGPLGTDDQATA